MRYMKSSRRFTLLDYIRKQIQLNPIIENFRIRNTPILVEKTFDKLHSMLENRIISATQVLTSFFDLNHHLHVEEHGQWNEDKESILDRAKVEVNEKGTI